MPEVRKSKVINSRDVDFVHGGSNHMFGKSGVAAQKPGTSATTRGKGGGKPHGGSAKMFGKSSVKAVKPA